jgi:predicted ATPase
MKKQQETIDDKIKKGRSREWLIKKLNEDLESRDFFINEVQEATMDRLKKERDETIQECKESIASKNFRIGHLKNMASRHLKQIQTLQIARNRCQHTVEGLRKTVANYWKQIQALTTELRLAGPPITHID